MLSFGDLMMNLMKPASTLVAMLLSGTTLAETNSSVSPNPQIDAAQRRAKIVVKQMKADEKVIMTHGIMPLSSEPEGEPVPDGAVASVGYVAGIPRLGIPALQETDAEMGVSYVEGLRKDGATGLPSGMAQGSTWNPALLRRAGAMIGSEARAKGMNVMLAGAANLVREPRNGRTFEYLSEDPLLTGVLTGASIDGIQSNHIISTIKHYALNGQETGRSFATMSLREAAARESDLLAFQIGIEQGRPGAVMCAYNKVRDGRSCDSRWLLTDVLKGDWGFKGFVMSDWGAVSKVEAALHGLDQQSAASLDPQVYFGSQLREKAASDPSYAARLDDMNVRILTSIYAHGLDRFPAKPGGRIDFDAHGDLAQEVASQGIVLLRNQGNVLPLTARANSIAVIGGYADTGVLTGAGSSEVQLEGGPAMLRPYGGEGRGATSYGQSFQRSIPLKAIKAAAPNAKVIYRDGRYASEAADIARKSDIAIVFATQWVTEGMDVPDLTLPEGQNELIAAVAAANPNTIVVLETGGPVLMPWRDKVAGILAAWFPGTRGANAIASVLFGKVNPSGRLPVTFPASEQQLPRPHLDGRDELEVDFYGREPYPGATLNVNYDIEGSDIGYRWFARGKQQPLYPFGFGLSYTTFETAGLKVRGNVASATVRNTGTRPGAYVAQLYLTARGDEKRQRLVGFQRVELDAGEQRTISMALEPRVLADWKDGKWIIPGGRYSFALGENAQKLATPVHVKMPARIWVQ